MDVQRDIYNGYVVESLPTYSMFQIKMQGSGPVPNGLHGFFTKRDEAYKAIDRYLSSLKGKKRNGKAKSTG